nr:zona pellucida sperm-binding protein 4-like isoform X4 [Pseudochaenichthys georgianus]
MAKHWSFTCLVALALLGCSVRTQAQEKAQNSRWQDPSPRTVKGVSPPQHPQHHQHIKGHKDPPWIPPHPHPPRIPKDPHPHPPWIPTDPHPHPPWIPKDPHPPWIPPHPHPPRIPKDPHPHPPWIPTDPHPHPPWIPKDPHPHPPWIPTDPHPHPPWIPKDPHPPWIPTDPHPHPPWISKDPHPHPPLIPKDPHPPWIPTDPHPHPPWISKDPHPHPPWISKDPHPHPPLIPKDPHPSWIRPHPPWIPKDPHPPWIPTDPHPHPPWIPKDPHPHPPWIPTDPHPHPPWIPKDPHPPWIPTDPHPPLIPKDPHPPWIRPHPHPPWTPKDPPAPLILQYDQTPQVQPALENDQKTQVPQTPSVYKPSVAKQPAAQSCVVAENVRIPCGSSDISAAGCEDINCCFDGRQCYYGKTVTVQCTKDAQFIVVVAKDSTLPNIDLESISLLGQGLGCTHVDSNSDFAIYNFPVYTCGSVVMEEPGVIIYENRMSSSFEVGVGDRGAITRDSHYELLFQCRYIGTSVEALVIEVLDIVNLPLPVAAQGPISVHLRLANGECNTKGCNEVDVAYTSFYTNTDYPVTKVLRDPVYVEVQLLEKTDPKLVLTLSRCWTTTSPNPHSLPQWDILIDGCPYRDDRYLSELVPVGPSSGLECPSHFRRFILKMFTFVNPNSKEPLSEQVFIHCSTAVCTSGAGRSCEPSCFRKRRDVPAADKNKAQSKVVVSVGPVIMGAPQQ